MRSPLLLILIVTLAGCAGIDDKSREALKQAHILIETDPEACLEQTTLVLQQHPHNADARRLSALAYEKLEKYHRAAREWSYIVDAGASSHRVLEAYRGILRLSPQILGDLPHVVRNPPRGEERNRIMMTLAACDAILDENPDDWDARFRKACCTYRLGLYHRARPLATELVEERPRSAGAQYLLVLIKEQQIGVHDRALETIAELIRSDDLQFRREAANHSIYLLSDPALPEIERANLRGHLIRFARSGDDVPEEVRAWLERYEALAVEELRQLRRQRLIAGVGEHRAASQWRQAWQMLSNSEELDEEIEQLRRGVATEWCSELLENGEHALIREQLGAARESIDQLEKLSAYLTARDNRGREAFAQRVDETERTIGLTARLKLIEEHVRMQRVDAAGKLLAELPEEMPSALAPKAQALRGEALALVGENEEALALFDGVQLTEPRQRRVHGILLADAKRADEARAVLESLPYGYLAGDALTALLTALESQRSWNDLLARLLTVPRPLSAEQRELRSRAATAQCRILLRRRLPDEALKILVSHTDAEERTQQPILEAYLEALMAAEEYEEAQLCVHSATPQVLTSLSSDVATQIADKIAPLVNEEERFGLLQHLRGSLPDESASKIYALWPRFGSYLPSPGSYVARYRSTAMDEEGQPQEPTYVEQTLTWAEPGFRVATAEAPSEEWSESSGIWHRVTQQGTMKIPVRIGGEGVEYPRLEYHIAGAPWIAELVESGSTVTVDTSEYVGCIRVKLSPKVDAEEAIYLDIAPLVGEVRRQVFAKGALQFTRELTELQAK